MSKSHEEYIKLLEELRWKGKPKCPYCGSYNAVKFRKRNHCNGCFTSFSVTVDTLFHKTRVDLDKWFLAIRLIHFEDISIRKLAKVTAVSKNTAEYMITRVKEAKKNESKLLKKIVTWIQENENPENDKP